MKTKVIIIGNAITAQIMFSVLSKDSELDVVAFSAHERFITTDQLFDTKIIPFENLMNEYPPAEVKLINAIGYSNVNKNREKIFAEAKAQGYSFLTYLHPSVSHFSKELGEGVFIMPGAVIEPFSTIGDNSVIWSNVVIAHHSVIEEHCWIASGSVIAGEARVKRNSFLGINASIVNKITVGEYNIIGARSLITKNTNANSVYLARSGELHRFPSDVYAQHFLV
jgi:sugar O-acyltransferase (sialic acid O-acetyltransferase NeuD family)